MTNSLSHSRGSPNKMTRVTLPNCLNVGVHLNRLGSLGCSHLKVFVYLGSKGGGHTERLYGLQTGCCLDCEQVGCNK